MEALNPIVHSTPLTGLGAYVHGLKERAQRHHCIGYGTLRADVEEMSRLRREYSTRIRPITILPILIKATALAVSRFPLANSILFRRWTGFRIVRFRDVDVNVPITRDAGDSRTTFLLIVRKADTKSLAEIQDQIESAMKSPPGEVAEIARAARAAKLPRFALWLYHRRMTRNPDFYARNGGTCGLTVMNEPWGEHFFPIGPTTCVFSVGGTRSEPVVEDGEVRIRRLMHVCVGVDNYVMSGFEGAEVARAFQALIEKPDFIRKELEAAR